MSRILVINASYRKDGITDQALEIMTRVAERAGAQVETVVLRDYPIEFCHNCRHCTQQPGEAPGTCVIDDGMQGLVEKIEQADGYVLASPTNFGSATALFKRFMERLIVYAYWPWEMNGPQMRKQGSVTKKALLVTSCAAPAFIGRWAYGTHKQLKKTATVIGAETVGLLYMGMIAKQPDPQLPDKDRAGAERLMRKLLQA